MEVWKGAGRMEKSNHSTLHKKGSKLDCQNYQGISLLSVPGKVYAKVLYERVKRIISGRIMELQGGFREGRSCIDQIFTLKQLMEKMIEKNEKMYVAFVDLEKAYDTVSRKKL